MTFLTIHFYYDNNDLLIKFYFLYLLPVVLCYIEKPLFCLDSRILVLDIHCLSTNSVIPTTGINQIVPL